MLEALAVLGMTVAGLLAGLVAIIVVPLLLIGMAFKLLFMVVLLPLRLLGAVVGVAGTAVLAVGKGLFAVGATLLAIVVVVAAVVLLPLLPILLVVVGIWAVVRLMRPRSVPGVQIG